MAKKAAISECTGTSLVNSGYGSEYRPTRAVIFITFGVGAERRRHYFRNVQGHFQPSQLFRRLTGRRVAWTHFPVEKVSIRSESTKLRGVERQEVLQLFADPDVADREAQLAGDGDHDSALGRAVQFVSTMPVTWAASVNRRACCRPFCPVVASMTSSVWCGARNLPLRRAAHLVQLLHQVGLRVQTAGGIDQQDVRRARFCGRRRVEERCRGIAALPGLDESDAGALRPDLELLDGRGAEGVGGAEQDGFAPRRKSAASLPLVVVLPVPFTPTSRMTSGAGAAWRTGAFTQSRMRRISSFRATLAPHRSRGRDEARGRAGG